MLPFDQWDESKHPRRSDGKFGEGGAPKKDDQDGESRPETEKPAGAPARDRDSAPKSGTKERKEWRRQRAEARKPSTPVRPEKQFFEERFTDEGGNWSAERQAMHQDILAGIAANVPRSSSPTFVLMGGGPASGKGSVLGSGSFSIPEHHMKIDADELKNDLPEYRQGLIFPHKSGHPDRSRKAPGG
jgi:hypothetical protein